MSKNLPPPSHSYVRSMANQPLVVRGGVQILERHGPGLSLDAYEGMLLASSSELCWEA